MDPGTGPEGEDSSQARLLVAAQPHGSGVEPAISSLERSAGVSATPAPIETPGDESDPTAPVSVTPAEEFETPGEESDPTAPVSVTPAHDPERTVPTEPTEPTPRSGAKRTRTLLLLGALCALTAAEYGRVVALLARRFANEDNALLWLTARDWGHLRPHQPNPYGQSYGTTIEAILIEILRRAGISIPTATPAVLGLLAVAGWLLLAWAAYRRDRRGLSVAALAIPLVLSAHHTVYLTSAWTTPVIRLGVLAGAAILIRGLRSLRWRSLAFGLIGLAAVMDPSTLLLGGPVVAWCVLDDRRFRHHVRAALIGAVAPAAWLIGWSLFYAARPDYSLHGSGGLSITPGWETLRASVDRPDRFFSLFRPELVHAWVVPVGALVGLVVFLLVTRQLRYAVPAALASLGVLAAMASPKAGVDGGTFLPPGRILLLLPATIWFLAFLAAESWTRPIRGRWAAKAPLAAVMAITLLALASFTVRSVEPARIDDLKPAAKPLKFGHVALSRVDDLVAGCEQIEQMRGDAPVVLFTQNLTLPYACPALGFGFETLVPRYERRVWRMYTERDTERTSALIHGVSPTFCTSAERRVISCEVTEAGALLTFAPQSVLDLFATFEMAIRPFGPGCRIEPASGFETATRTPSVAVCASGRDEALRLPRSVGDPTPDVGARDAITTAYEELFETGEGFGATVEPGMDLTRIAMLLEASPAFQQGPRAKVEGIRQVNPRVAVVEFRIESTFDDAEPDGLLDRQLRSIVEDRMTLTGQAVRADGRWTVSSPTFCRVSIIYGVPCLSLSR